MGLQGPVWASLGQFGASLGQFGPVWAIWGVQSGKSQKKGQIRHKSRGKWQFRRGNKATIRGTGVRKGLEKVKSDHAPRPPFYNVEKNELYFCFVGHFNKKSAVSGPMGGGGGLNTPPGKGSLFARGGGGMSLSGSFPALQPPNMHFLCVPRTYFVGFLGLDRFQVM